MIVALVDRRDLAVYSDLELPGGGNARERVLAFARQTADRVVYLERSGRRGAADADDDVRDADRTVYAEDDSATAALNALGSACEGADALVYVRADEPFYQSDLTRTLLDDHLRYGAHYTFSDGYPAGVSPEIVAPGLPALLRNVAGEGDRGIGPGWLFAVLERDINAFDVETRLAPRDMRMLRVELRCDTRLNYTVCRRLAEADIAGHHELVDFVDEHRELLRTVPAFVGVQIIDGCPQACSYCPFPRFGGDILTQRNAMPVEHFRSIVGKIADFSPEAVVGVSTWGEPLLHPDLAGILDAITATESLGGLVETSGVGMSADHVLELVERSSERIKWIVSLDSNDEDGYRALRGDGFAAAHEVAHLLVERFPERVWIQAVRMHENEEALEDFYRYWKERTDHVIIQKYDHFSGKLPQRKVTDLSPLTRYPCWQNKRELYIRLDGSVPRCREDIHSEFTLGNLFSDPIETVWENGEQLHRKHIAGTYPDICGECDEYYTFNF